MAWSYIFREKYGLKQTNSMEMVIILYPTQVLNGIKWTSAMINKAKPVPVLTW